MVVHIHYKKKAFSIFRINCGQLFNMSNTTIFVLNPHPYYSLLPFIWTFYSITLIGSAIAISYLNSKPPLTHTIMDYVNKISFIEFILSGKPNCLVSSIHFHIIAGLAN